MAPEEIHLKHVNTESFARARPLVIKPEPSGIFPIFLLQHHKKRFSNPGSEALASVTRANSESRRQHHRCRIALQFW